MKIKIDEIEQEQHNKSVRIVGMPEEEDAESDIRNIQKLAATKFEMNLNKTDVRDIYRLGRVTAKKNCRDMIIKFKKKSARDQFYNNRKKLTSNSVQPNIYINEQLTEYRANLFFAARKLVKRRKLHSTWTQRGNVLVRKDESEKPKQIRHHKELSELTGEFYREDSVLADEAIVSDNPDSSEEDD